MLKSKIVQKWIVALPSSMHCIFLCSSRVLKVETENSWHWCACLDFRAFWLLLDRDGEKMLSFGFCPNYLQPPHSPQFGKLVQLFSDVEIQDLKVSLGLKILYIHYNILYIQPKNRFWKGDKNFRQGPPLPSFEQTPNEQQLFFRKPSHSWVIQKY